MRWLQIWKSLQINVSFNTRGEVLDKLYKRKNGPVDGSCKCVFTFCKYNLLTDTTENIFHFNGALEYLDIMGISNIEVYE